MHRPKRLLIAAAGALALLFAWLLLRGRGGPADAPPAPVAAHRAAPTGSGTVADLPPEVAPLPLDEPTQAAPGLPGASPYPPGSQPLTEGSDPARSVAEDDPVDADSGVHVVFGPRRDVVHPPEPIVIDLEVLDRAGHRLPIGNARAYFRNERDTAATGTGARVAFVDEGKLGYVARFAPTPTEQQQIMRFRTFVEVAFDAPNHLGERHYSASVQYTPRPKAELDGTYSDAIVDGSLVVQAGVAVAEAGRYKLIASLYAGDQAIAFAQSAGELEVGHRSLALTFFGKILHDRELDGPYTLRYAMLFEEFPAQGIYWPGTTVDPAYTTRAYKWTELSAAPYVEPAPTGPPVTAESPSQQGKPPPLYTR